MASASFTASDHSPVKITWQVIDGSTALAPRRQAADYEKLKGQIADLRGERRGHVAIACSQAFVPYFLPATASGLTAAITLASASACGSVTGRRRKPRSPITAPTLP
ncbi:MAG: hypothetical protein Q7J44_05640 [Pseudotabrizicola sp.]|nr:hypothetical protein [Pseudotabrizicola sp.]